MAINPGPGTIYPVSSNTINPPYRFLGFRKLPRELLKRGNETRWKIILGQEFLFPHCPKCQMQFVVEAHLNYFNSNIMLPLPEVTCDLICHQCGQEIRGTSSGLCMTGGDFYLKDFSYCKRPQELKGSNE